MDVNGLSALVTGAGSGLGAATARALAKAGAKVALLDISLTASVKVAGEIGGVAAVTLPAAHELAKTGIRVLAIAPGLFGTPMLFGLPDEVQENLGALVAFPPRLGDPDEYAKLVMHMANNVMLNGEVVRLDGDISLSPI